MKVAFHDYCGKGSLLRQALVAAGHAVDGPGPPDVYVTDHDLQTYGDRDPVVLYAHGGAPILSWDGHYAPRTGVRLHLTHGVGQAQILAAYGYPVPTVPVGWLYSDVAAPRYGEVRRVLFAPMHPLGTGYLPDDQREANQRTFAKLSLHADFELTVRTWGRPTQAGVPEHPGVTYVDYGGTLDTASIDAADLVVAEGTLAHLALARGVPTIFIGSDLPPDVGHTAPLIPTRWPAYADLMRYPVDIDDGPLSALVDAVTTPSASVEDYRRRFVGGPFDPQAAVRLVEAVAAP